MLKRGDVVKTDDLSFSMYIMPNGQLGSYHAEHYSISIGSQFNKATMYRVISSQVIGLPAWSCSFNGPYSIPNDTIVQDVKTGEIIFMREELLFPVCPVCGEKIVPQN